MALTGWSRPRTAAMPSASRSFRWLVPCLAAVALGLGLLWLTVGGDATETLSAPGKALASGSEGEQAPEELREPRGSEARRGSLRAGGESRREIVLAGEGPAPGPSVRVLGPHGEPIEGALVFAGWPWNVDFDRPVRTGPLAETDASGDAVFSLADCPRIDGRFELVALHPDWGAARGFFRELGSASRLVMGEPLEALVEVRNLADVPVLGRISVGPAPRGGSPRGAPDRGPSEPWIRRQVDQVPGTAQLRVRGLPAGGMPLFIGAGGYGSELAWIHPNAAAAPVEEAGGSREASAPQVVRLGNETLVEFRVTSRGEPCAGITVRVPGHSPEHRLLWRRAAGTTNSGGRVSLALPEPVEGAGATLPRCTVTGSGFEPTNERVTREELRRGWKSIELGERAPEGATLRAALIDSEGRPAHVGVSAIRLDQHGFRARTSHSFLGHENADPNGVVEFSGLPTGTPIGLRIEPRAGVNSGVITTHTEPMLSPGEMRSVTVRTGELVIVHGTILVDGELSPGLVYGTTESRLGERYGQFSVEVGAAGTFVLSLPRAVYRLGALLGEGVTKEELVLDLTSPPKGGNPGAGGARRSEVAIKFDARRKAPLRGRLVDGSGDGIAHRSILICSSGASSAAMTDVEGHFVAEFVSPRLAGLWIASRDGRLWDMGRLRRSKEHPSELGEIAFDERPVLVTIVDGSGNPVRVGGQQISLSRPKPLASPMGGKSTPRMPLATDATGRVALWMPSGEHRIGAPSNGKLVRVPEGAGKPHAPFMIEVRDGSKVSYEWQRPLAAQGNGVAVITGVGESEPFRLRLGVVAGSTKALYLARGRYEIAFEGEGGARTLETIDLRNRPARR